MPREGSRGNGRQDIFLSDDDRHLFLSLLEELSERFNIEIYAYVLMNNHYHLLIKTLDANLSKAMQWLGTTYTRHYNNKNSCRGHLFQGRYKSILVENDAYLSRLSCYIHRNPIKDWKDYKFSSFHYYIEEKSPKQFKLDKNYSLKLFDDLANLKVAHRHYKNEDLQCFENLAGQVHEKPKTQKLQDPKDEIIVEFDLTTKDKFFKYIHELQDTIASGLEAIDGKAKFQEDVWKRPEGGGGRTRVIENGNVFEKGGVNISGVHGKLPDSMQNYFGVEDADFFACGLSLVLHPKNPMVPTVHANWRYFEMYDKEGNIVDQWFGGGQDLTPYYLFEDDAKHFHQTCKTACDKHHPEFYPKYKARCDEYFWNSHRNEARGLGGLFFDYCKATDDTSMQNWYDFVTEVGDSFLEAYVPIVEKRKDLPYTKEQRNWQEIRRGRYVEFNLVHDKGTLFGLKTNGRIESILMSLPPHVQWVYDHHPETGSEEDKIVEVLKHPKAWID